MEIHPAAMEAHSGAIVVHQESRVLTLQPWNLTPVQLRLHQSLWAYPGALGQCRLILESCTGSQPGAMNTHLGAMDNHPIAIEANPGAIEAHPRAMQW
jgi:hypothetical protein